VPKPAPATPSPAGDPEPAGTWQRHARILHLSDLHFGPHCIEQKRSAEEQLERLTAVLDTMASQCSGGDIPECPIIEALFDTRVPPPSPSASARRSRPSRRG